VIRYDQRDTGRSTTYPAGQASYSVADLQADAVGVLDVLGLRAAHLAGMSLGGTIALRIGLDQPERVETLTLFSTSPGGPGLPPMSDQLGAYFETAPWPPDWSDPVAVVGYLVDAERAFAAPRHFDEAAARARAERTVERAVDIAAGLTNWTRLGGGEPVRPRLGEVAAPALVVHGTADPLYPFGHAETLAGELPVARLLPLDGVGHQPPPPPVWPGVIAAVLRHTSGDRP
jgi:pimeloyl-ACP methyl ester carboxylesterase